MLSKNLKTIRSINGQLKRYLSAGQTQTKSSSSPSIQVSTLPSGVVLASAESESPLARVAVVVRAGARYEPQSKLGISHIVRSSAGLGTENFSSFGITRQIEYHGGRLTVAGTRDSITYLLEVHNDEEVLPKNFTMVADSVSRPAFKHWEIADNTERLMVDRSLLEDTPFIQLTELIHHVSFRGGLRNSLYVPKFMVGKHSAEDLKKFHRETFVGSNTVVVGLGIDHQQLTELVGQSLVLPASTGMKESSDFIGGEIHQDSCSPLTYVAIACEGVSINKSLKDYIAAALLQKILGAGSQIKNSYELNQAQRLSQAVKAQLSGKSSENVSVASFNYNYENTGLFGVHLVAPNTCDITAMAKSVVKEFRTTMTSISDAELNDAKNNLKTSALIALDDEAALVYEMGTQLLMTGQKFSIEDYLKQVDSTTMADVKSLGSRMMKSKIGLATIGQNAPYLNDIQ
ncbi:ubiquinol-cytochrome c reductase core protein 2 [Dermatophagoides farinae]|uniref:ubiquinol-cytochrome c reductase core protein 2 n=1 Tax=Dermatophagoides farinae TaxID=6954 RepID=UPI003F63B14A